MAEHPEFRPATFERIELGDMTALSRYKFLTATVVPRPIALVSTLNPNGSVNLAPFSQFVILSASPPILGIVSGRHPDGRKDTHSNILRTGEFVINTVDEALAVPTQQSAYPFRPEISETELLGLGTRATTSVAGRAVAASPLAFECRLVRTESFGETATLIAGEVVAVTARQGLVSGHRVAHDKLRPLGRIAGRDYCRTGEVVSMPPDLDAAFAALGRHNQTGKVLP
ncbi:flavin reductase family protein [Roseovarius sp.]|uniref:flavin reductase family protein n=1 Tax=Roseovarius sp. TaxID=1486281 RepID=UPI0035193DC6